MFGRKKGLSGDIGLYIGANTSIEGKVFSTTGYINIAGVFTGDIVSQDLVIVSESGKLDGSVKAKDLHVFGKVKGTVDIENEIVIGRNGVIEGEASYGSLHVEEGGQIRGKMMPKTKGSMSSDKKGTSERKNKK